MDLEMTPGMAREERVDLKLGHYAKGGIDVNVRSSLRGYPKSCAHDMTIRDGMRLHRYMTGVFGVIWQGTWRERWPVTESQHSAR